MEHLMFDELLKKAREGAGMSQDDLKEASGVSVSNISRYENSHRNPSDESLDALIEALEVDQETEDRMREAVRRARDKTTGPNGMVDDPDKIEPWTNAVLSSELPGNARIILANARHLLDEQSWVVAATTEEIADAANLSPSEVESAIHHALDSPFLERIGSVEWAFRLTFPEGAGDDG